MHRALMTFFLCPGHKGRRQASAARFYGNGFHYSAWTRQVNETRLTISRLYNSSRRTADNQNFHFLNLRC